MEPVADGMPNDILIVEDDPIIALDFEDTLLGFGVKTVRTAARRGQGARTDRSAAAGFCAARCQPDREKSFAVAERLEALNIPFAFVTGYGADARLPAAFADTPRLPKPYSTDALLCIASAEALAQHAGYTRFGSSVVDHNATSARSRKVTIIWPVAPSILTWPKNCMPADGGRFCLPARAP